MSGGRVVALGLDSVDLDLLSRYIGHRQLPNISRLHAQSAVATLNSRARYRGGDAEFASTEGNWVMFQTGVHPTSSGYWETVRFDPNSYRSTNDFVNGGYDFGEFQPFYALGSRFRVVTFDIPVSKVVSNVQGAQVVGWGGHFPYVVRGAQPPDLLREINRNHGRNRILYRDHGVFWRSRYRDWLQHTAARSIRQRVGICDDMLNRFDPHLLVAVVGETHSVLHDLWASIDKGHPLYEVCSRPSVDPILEVLYEVDALVGRLTSRLRPRDSLVLFSVHGMHSNVTDLACLFFLPELLYRFNFPGRFGLAWGDSQSTPPPPITFGLHWYWFGEIWRRLHSGVRGLDRCLSHLPAWCRWQWPGSDLRFPFALNLKGPASGWMPSMWYRPTWPRSRSFALPSFADGHIRVNLASRESRGMVPAVEYEAECERIRRFLLQVRCARSGQPIVREVIRTRDDPLDTDPTLPLGDLIVVFGDQPFDIVDSPLVGRIGPVPFFRTGGHRSGGFAMIRSERVTAGTTLPDAEVCDLPPTLLRLLGADIPAHFEGRPFSALAGKSPDSVVKSTL